MSNFRDFLSKDTLFDEFTMYKPGLSRVAGVYNLPDLKAGTQRYVDPNTGKETPMIPVGGIKDPAHAAQWKIIHKRWNDRYPLDIHGVQPAQFDMKEISYEQAKAAFIDLANRISSIGSVIASGGNVPGGEKMTARMREAIFSGQTFGKAPDENTDIYLIYNVDGRAFFGEVSGRGGTLGFKLGEALRIITPTEWINPNIGVKRGNSYDINVRILEHHLKIALKEFTRWERGLEAIVWRGEAGNWILQQLAQTGGVKTNASINAMALAAMDKH